MSEQADADDVVKTLYEEHDREILEIIAAANRPEDAFLALFRLGYRLDHTSPFNRSGLCPECGEPMQKWGPHWRCHRCRVTWVRAVPAARMPQK